MKIALIGCGLRTPLLTHGLSHGSLAVSELSFFDLDPDRASLMKALGDGITEGRGVSITTPQEVEQCLDGADFVISSFRAGGMEARARDERIALEHGYAGQETTGPAGFAMALRTVPIALHYARIVERVAPRAWLLNFTNPAGLVTQAITTYTGVRVAGICDTPAELFYRIANVLEVALDRVQFDYFGLNHLGWVRSVFLDGEDVMPRLLEDRRILERIYPEEMFSADLMQGLRLIPTEYLFFYYGQRAAAENQRLAGATRGEELRSLNERLFQELHVLVGEKRVAEALAVYRAYLNRRNASYMRLEAFAQSALEGPDPDWNPFEGATGYHRIAIEAIAGLLSPQPSRVVLNVPNHGAIPELEATDVVEVPCVVSRSGAQPAAIGTLPREVKGLLHAVKTYERKTIEAALHPSRARAALALTLNPIVGDWRAASALVEALCEADPGLRHAFQRADGNQGPMRAHGAPEAVET